MPKAVLPENQGPPLSPPQHARLLPSTLIHTGWHICQPHAPAYDGAWVLLTIVPQLYPVVLPLWHT